jgi:hypothetical protein
MNDADLAQVIAALNPGADEAELIEAAASIAGDEIHAILKRHAMTMPSVAAAVALGVHVAAQMLVETVEFADRAMEGGEDGEVLKRAATTYFSDLFAQSVPGHLRIVGNA